MTDLKNVEVTVLYLNRANAQGIQNRAHISFWERYIDSLKGKITYVKRIDG